MKHMIQGVIAFLLGVFSFVAGYAILSQPLHIIITALTNAHPNPSQIVTPMLSLELMFGGGCVFGIILLFVWLFVWGQKFEHEIE